MTKVGDAYGALISAMEKTVPKCRDSLSFTEDNPSKLNAAKMAELCGACPLLDLCKEYAQLERPKAGFWAGRQYPTKKADPE